MTEATEILSMILSDQWDDEITKVVGEIVIAFGQLEHVLWVAGKRSRKLSMQEWAELREGGRTVPEKCRYLREEFTRQQMDDTLRSDLHQTLDKIVNLAETRNRIVHGRWGVKKLDGKIISKHRIWQNRDAGVDVAKMIALRNGIRDARDRLNRLTRGLMDNR